MNGTKTRRFLHRFLIFLLSLFQLVEFGVYVSTAQPYLNIKEDIDSVSGAQFHLRQLDAYDKESAAYKDTTLGVLTDFSATLEKEVYENIDDVKKREAVVVALFPKLNALSKKKHPVLEDDLARETFKTKSSLAVHGTYRQVRPWSKLDS